MLKQFRRGPPKERVVRLPGGHIADDPPCVPAPEKLMSNEAQLQKSMQRIEEIVQQIEGSADLNLRSSAVELVQLLMDLNGSGMARMLKIVSETAGAAGADLVRQFGRDDLVGQLLILYNLHPVDFETRVRQAIDKVRPGLQSQGGAVELLGISDGVVRLRLDGNCNGCTSSTLNLKKMVEDAICESAADVVHLEITGPGDQQTPAGFVPLESVTLGTANR